MIRRAVADFLRYCSNAMALTNLTQAGADALISIHAQLEDLGALEDNDRDRGIIEQGKIAKSEVERGFPLLHAHALMGAWGALEVLIDDVCVGWLAETDGQAASGMKLRVPLGEFLSLQGVEKWRWLLEQIRRDQSSSLKPGIAQFEALLDSVGLGGEVDDALRKALFLSKQYRNIIAHRGGRVDAKFVKDCPTVEVRVGDQLQVTRGQLFAALNAMIVYAESVLHRTVRARGGTRVDTLPPWVLSTQSLVDALEVVVIGTSTTEDEPAGPDEPDASGGTSEMKQ